MALGTNTLEFPPLSPAPAPRAEKLEAECALALELPPSGLDCMEQTLKTAQSRLRAEGALMTLMSSFCSCWGQA